MKLNELMEKEKYKIPGEVCEFCGAVPIIVIDTHDGKNEVGVCPQCGLEMGVEAWK